MLLYMDKSFYTKMCMFSRFIYIHHYILSTLSQITLTQNVINNVIIYSKKFLIIDTSHALLATPEGPLSIPAGFRDLATRRPYREKHLLLIITRKTVAFSKTLLAWGNNVTKSVELIPAVMGNKRYSVVGMTP